MNTRPFSRGLPTEPVHDVPSLVVALQECGLFSRSEAAISYQVRFGSAAAVEAAADQGLADGWEAAVFADPEGWVLRLACHGTISIEGLRRDEGYVRAIAADYGGLWHGFAAEPRESHTVWEAIAERSIAASAERAPTPEGKERATVPRQRRPSESEVIRIVEHLSTE